ncbi:zinc-dependent alcohol dehydrogenase family protein [Streptomyces sp. NPDC053427]|uniref:zinc-dependent alcohol dehydrogenase family protein n=1 Tax=Streptomyces sp. NPDC053427 TaxID=3365701 RepID=UPI0037D1F5BF
MRAVVIHAPEHYEATTVDDPTPGPGEVVVAPAAVGICGTDVHIVQGEFAPTPYPIIPGHEFTGEIVALGAGVTGLRTGQQVAIDPSLFCGACHYCAIGHGNLCENWGAIGDTVDGAMAEYVKVPAANCYRLPESVDVAQGTLIEPLSCAVRGFDVLPRRLGDHYLIYGAGTMGLMMLQLAKTAGAASLSVVDINRDRLKIAEQLGADATAVSASNLDRPQGWETVIDCTGVIPVIEDGLTRVRRGGTFLQFGVAPSAAKASFSPFRVYNDEITIAGSMAVLHSFGRAVDLMAKGVVDADTMITHSFGLDDFGAALQTFRDGSGRKIQLRPQA